MSEGTPEELDDRIIMLAPTSRDAAVSRTLLAVAGIPSFFCSTLSDVCREIVRGAGAALLTAEAVLGETADLLVEVLKAQPPWSDLPLIVLTPTGPDSPRLFSKLEAVGPMTLMKRPVQVSSLVSTIRAALRDRRRQYAVRDLLAERQRAAEDLRAERERYRVTLASIGDAVIATDTEGIVTFQNSVAESLTGWAGATGRPLADVFRIVNEHTRQPAENPALRTLQEGTPVGLANHTLLISRDGTERPIDDSVAPIRDVGDTTVGAVLVFRDVSERKRSEHARARLAAIVESSHDAIISKTLDGVIQSWNAGAERIFGYAASEAVGQSITLIIPSDRLDEERMILDRLRQGERIEHFETVRLTKDGRLLDISLTVSPLRDPRGKIIGASKVARDITYQRLAAEQLRESERRFRTLFETMGEGFCIVEMIYDSEGRPVDYRFLETNPKFEAHTGLRDAVGRTIREMVPGHDSHWFETYGRVAATGEAVRITDEARALGKWYDIYAYRAGSAGSNRVAILFTDITDRKRAEDNLIRLTADSERRKRLYETILSNTLDLVYVFDLAHRFIYANDALLKTWGKTWEESIGKTCLELGYEPGHAEMHDREIEEVVATKRPIRGEVPFTGTNGLRMYDYIFVPVIGAAGEVEAIAGTTRDVTDLKQTEAALRESDRKKDDFIALLAHELRNPLAPIRNGLQVIRLSRGETGTADRALAVMDRQLDHMVRLIDDLLDVSRITRNKMELRRARVALGEVLDSAVETSRPAVDQARHDLTISIPARPLFLDADLTRLAQVFSNLLINSAKYTEPCGKIWLSAREAEGTIVVSVRDTGIGIPAESLPTIFDMFSQVDPSFERSTGGLGIGLALVKGLVEMHGGTVAAESSGPGRGSTFTVTLPAAGNPETAVPSADSGPAIGRSSRRVLVVDDNEDGAESLAEMLRLLGHEVDTAHDGLEAVKAADRLRPEVILMDVGLPKLSGLDATRHIRERPWGKSVTVVALTGWGQDNDRERSREAGCDEHLVKPVKLADLEKVLNMLAR
jgi:PAS domain S-box-containing protein